MLLTYYKEPKKKNSMTEKDSMLEVFMARSDSKSSKLSSTTDPEIKSRGKTTW